MLEALTAAGVDRFVALPYAHRPGVAADVNAWVCDRAATSGRVVPFATVHAGDEDVGDVVASAVADGARGLKFQLPVQGFAADDPRLDPAYEVAAEGDLPVLMHAGTAPMYREDPNITVDNFRSFRASFPEIRVCVAHMGTYDVEAYLDIARSADNVFLDTTFAMSSVATEYMDFDPASVSDEDLIDLSDSVMYGSDYPNIPYPYAREREHLLGRALPEPTLRDVFSRTARRFLGEA